MLQPRDPLPRRGREEEDDEEDDDDDLFEFGGPKRNFKKKESLMGE